MFYVGKSTGLASVNDVFGEDTAIVQDDISAIKLYGVDNDGNVWNVTDLNAPRLKKLIVADNETITV